MPRAPRLHVPGGCYHVTLRGNHREALFETTSDRCRLDDIVADALDRFDMRLHAYCWMTNHLHALVQVNAQPLGGFAKSVATRYARFRHKRLDTTGHLFERRHGGRLVQVDSYFLAVLRYIHLNPVNAGIVADPAAWPWSSHRAYLGRQSISWLTTSFGLSLFGADGASAARRYAEFLGTAPTEADEALEERINGQDDRVLGDDAFAAEILPAAAVSGDPSRLDELARQFCADQGLSIEHLRSKDSRRQLTPIRLALLDRALRTGAASLSEVARYLGRDPSTLSKQWKQARTDRGAIHRFQ